MKKITFLLSFLTVILFSHITFSQVININVTSTTGATTGDDIVGQSFTANGTGTLDEIRILAIAGVSGRTLTIRSGEGLFGTILGTLSNITIKQATGYTDYTFIDVSGLGISLINGNVYTFAFEGGGGNVVNLIYDSTGSSIYSGGQFYQAAGTNATIDLIFGVDIALPSNVAPTITTTVASSVSTTSAIIGGNVTADGGASVTDRGIVWSTSVNPTISNNKVSNGAGTGAFSATVSSLPSASKVYYRAFATNSVGTSYGSELSFTTLATQPTVAANTITQSSISQTGMTVGWTNGNGARRIVVAKSGSSVSVDPADGNGYTPNAAFGSGTDLGSGNFIVYSGTGTSVNLTGLTAGTTYHFKVIEFNGTSGTANYFLVGAPTANSTTLVPDTTKPVITICAATPADISANTSCEATTLDLTGGVTATDNSGVTPVITQSPVAGTTLYPGTNLITITATDGAGNTATCTVNQKVVDSAKPSVTCPGNQIETPDFAGNFTLYDYTGIVTATDNCGIPTVTQSPVAGTVITVTTTITMTATDGAGNKNTCTFDVILPDNTAPVFENSTPSSSSITETGFILNTDIDEVGSIYYVVVADGATSPTSTEVKAGTGSGGSGQITSGNAAVASGGFTNAFSITGLTTVTAYDLYVVAQDDEWTPNLQTNPTKIEVTTTGLILSTSQTNATGNGLSDGTATVSVTGGTAPYFIQWSDGQTSATATGLAAGDYTVTVRDDNGNGNPKTSNTITITQPDKLIATIGSQTNISIYGTSTGAVTIAVVGGVAPYTYQWNTGDTTASVAGYPAGNYNVRVTDANGIVAKNDTCIESLCVKLLQAPSVITNDATGIKDTEATLTGSVSTDGGAVIIERGILLVKTSVNSNPTIDDSNLYAHIKVTNLSYALNYQPDNLDTNVEYSFVVYATNSAGTSYGAVKTFIPKTPVKPTVNTIAADTITMTRVFTGIDIVNQGSSPVTESGIVYALTDENPHPEIGDGKSKQLDRSLFTYAGLSWYSDRTYIENLTPGTGYSFKAYAINNVGTSYGDVKTFTTLKDSQSITFAALANKTYGDVAYNLAAKSSSGLAVTYTSSNTTVATVSGNVVTIVGAGSTNITASQVGNTTYYAATNVVQELTVNKATLTATAVDKSREYGDVNPTFTISYSGFKNNETASVLGFTPVASSTATVTTDAGTAVITVSNGTSNNYTIVPKDGTLTINKAVLIVTALDATAEYGDNFSIDFKYGAFKNGEDSTVLNNGGYVRFAEDVTNAGTYTIIPDAVDDNNYTASYVTGTFIRTKATLNVTAEAKSKTYGDANPTLTFTHSGFKYNETLSVIDTAPTVTTTATTSTNVGTAAIIVSGGLDNNYDFAYTSANLTINQALLTATADDKSREYGDANPAFTIEYSGFKNGETTSVIDSAPTATTTATTSTNVGTASISVSGGSDANYTISPNNGTLTISKAPLIVTAKNTTAEYGDNFSIDFEYGAFKNGEDSSVLDTGAYVYIVGSAPYSVGTYPIVPDAVDDNNYVPSYVNGILTINKATLTATADDKAKSYGDANPAFTISYSGFKNGDDSTNLDMVSTASTTATVTSDAGIYDITLSDGLDTNYTITETKGVLTITSILPSVVTNVVTNIAGVAATFNGDVTSTGGEPNVTRGFVYSVTNMIPTLSDSKVDVATGIGSFIKNEVGLTSETTYYTRAFATNSKGTVYGDVKEFTTLDITPPIAPIVANIDNYTCANNTSSTADTTLVFNGSAEPNSIVEVFVSTVSVGTVIANSTGNWSFDHSATVLADGVYNITATATDISTNTSNMSATLIIIIDTRDFDEDGNPDFCDDDDDNDGVLDVNDNSYLPNPDQADTNNNGIGDVQEDCDNDGVLNFYDTDVASCQEPILKKKTYGFSPNGDGINDAWTVEDIQLFPNNVVQIFNRSGKVVFKMKGYDNSFEGAFKGEKLPVGTYLFIIDLGNGSKPTKGWIYINY